MMSLSTVMRRMTTLLVAGAVTLSGFAPAAMAQSDRDHKQHQNRGAKPAQQAPTRQISPPAPQARVHTPPSRPPQPSVVVRQAPPAVRHVEPPRHHSHHDGRRRYNNSGIAIGVGAAIIGATLGYRYYRGPNRESVYQRCDRNFPDFDWDTGTFENEDGDRELCPYLRPYID